MYVYILTGKLFGKDIYEIDVLNTFTKRLESDVYGYPEHNKILFIREIKFYNGLKFKKSLENFKLRDNFYRITLNKAIDIIMSSLKTYDIEPEPDVPVKSGCLSFNY